MTVVLQGRRLRLTPFVPALITDRYLNWLSDPIVNQFSRRNGIGPVTREAALQYLSTLRADEAIFAVTTAKYGHIGNIKYGPIDRVRSCCDIAILMGDTTVWGKGFGTEAVYLVTRWLFERKKLDRVEAGSGNPAFLRLVEGLGWKIECVRSKSIRVGDQLFNWTTVALEASNFKRRAQLEARDDSFVVRES